MNRPFQFSLSRLLGAVTFLSLAGASATAGLDAPNPFPGLALGFISAGAAIGVFLDGWRGIAFGAILGFTAFGLWASSETAYMPRPQFTLQASLVLLLAVVCFFSGIGFERERKRREDKEVEKYVGMVTLLPTYPDFPVDSLNDSSEATAERVPPGAAS